MRRASVVTVLGLLLFLFPRSLADAAAPVLGNKPSFFPSVSGDGRYVAFASNATNLVGGDTNKRTDVFVRDRIAGTTRRVSVSTNGSQTNGASTKPVITPDGRYVAFESAASNLVAGDTNTARDVFVRDLVGKTTTRVSLTNNGAQGNGGSFAPAITPDARFIAFESDATNLVGTQDTNGRRDVFVRDRSGSKTVRASVPAIGLEMNNDSYGAAISDDGNLVAFLTNADNVPRPCGNDSLNEPVVRDMANDINHEAPSDRCGLNYGTRKLALSADGLSAGLVLGAGTEEFFTRAILWRTDSVDYAVFDSCDVERPGLLHGQQ